MIIKIGAAGDPALFPEFDIPPEKAGQIVALGILEKGTERGRTSVAIVIQLPDGSRVLGETTAQMLVNGMASATRGAMERFGDDPNVP